jgi:hypothetical protein
MATPSKAVLITGCSTGIGRATAQRLAAAQWKVYATARRPETIADLEQAGCRTLALDVTDEHSMSAAVAAVEQAEGAVGVLINNAGYSQSGAVESIPSRGLGGRRSGSEKRRLEGVGPEHVWSRSRLPASVECAFVRALHVSARARRRRNAERATVRVGARAAGAWLRTRPIGQPECATEHTMRA